jgi:Mg-chelatase subunit ChlI
VRKASKVYNVPMQTVRDRVLGHVDPETTRLKTINTIIIVKNVIEFVDLLLS